MSLLLFQKIRTIELDGKTIKLQIVSITNSQLFTAFSFILLIKLKSYMADHCSNTTLVSLLCWVVDLISKNSILIMKSILCLLLTLLMKPTMANLEKLSDSTSNGYSDMLPSCCDSEPTTHWHVITAYHIMITCFLWYWETRKLTIIVTSTGLLRLPLSL